MKPVIYAFTLLFISIAFFNNCLNAQNLGVGTNAPDHRIHIEAPSSALLKLENSNSLNTAIRSDLYFKTGGFYTGAIKTIGTGINTARLGLFTYAAGMPSSLLERLSILDNGNVGINNTNPTTNLEVTGKTKMLQAGDDAALEVDGKIKLSGATRSAFVLTTSASNLSADGTKITIDHPFCNGDPNAMLFVTAINNASTVSITYNPGILKWQIIVSGYRVIDASLSAYKSCADNCIEFFPVHPLLNRFYGGEKLNVMIISQ